MEREEIEYVIALSEVITTNILTRLNLIPEKISESKAIELHGKRLIDKWRIKGYIKTYPGTSNRIYYKLSELEIASRIQESTKLPKTKSLHGQLVDEISKKIIESQIKSQSHEKSKNHHAIPVKL